MVESKKIFPTLVGLITFGLIGVYIYNKVQIGGAIGTTPIIAFLLIGFAFFAFLKLAENFGAGKLDLDNIFLPLVALGLIVGAFLFIPQLITQTFSLVDSNVEPIKSPLNLNSFNILYLLIPIGALLLFKKYRTDIRRKLKI